MYRSNINSKELIHFVGIGGIGMSGLAQVMKTMGFNVQGSDLNKSKNTDRCKKIGIKIFYGHNPKNIKKSNLIVKSSAIKNSNPEIIAAKKNKITVLSRSEMLAHVVSLKKNIVITGSHGKTTTTSLISKILSEAGLDPTIINGGIINSLNSNARLGRGKWAVLEADESDGSFLKIPINYSIVTNIDYEHIEYYKSFKNLEKSFLKFIEKTPPTGKSIICIDNKNIKKISGQIKNKNIITYGENKNSNYKITNIRYKIDYTIFDLSFKNINKKNKKIKNIKLKLLGKHNVLNATAAIILCLNLGINENIIKRSLEKFSGVQRRMTKIFTKNENDFYDDYAHHPTEISSILEGVKNVYKHRQIISVFEPHRYSRVLSLKSEFSKSFSKSNLVLLCPLYAAGEKKNSKFNIQEFAKSISKASKTQVIIIKDFNELGKYFKKNLMSDELIIGMGAGTISKHMNALKNIL